MVEKNLPKNITWQDITYNKISVSLLEIFRKHIGEDKSISKEDLFKKIYNMDYDIRSPSHYMLWEFVKRSMNKVRRESKCFISSKQNGHSTDYFVVKDQNDADYYVDRLNKTIKKMKYMMNRAQKSVDEKWYRQSWELKFQEKKRLK